MIAHRGYSQLAPENTIPAFELAFAAGADMVELDYHQTQDGIPIVIHDATLDRTTDAPRRWGRRNARVDAHAAAEVQSLDAGSWFGPTYTRARMPLLKDALHRITKRCFALVEHKAGDAPTCIKLLQNKRLAGWVIVQSMDWSFLNAVHRALPKQAVAALGPPHVLPDGKKARTPFRSLNRRWLEQARRIGARVVVWNRHVSKAAIQTAHRRGFKVWVYTINEARLAKRLLAMGVDGIITNNPTLLRALVQNAETPCS